MSKMKKTRKPGGGRKKLKPEYDAGKNLKDQMDAAVALYEEDCSLQSIADVLNLNPIKVRKLLITAGVYESEVAEKVQDTFERYRKTQDYKTSILSTATVLGLSKASVTSYLPYEKGVYFPNTADKGKISVGAERQRRYRAMKRWRTDPTEEHLWEVVLLYAGVGIRVLLYWMSPNGKQALLQYRYRNVKNLKIYLCQICRNSLKMYNDRAVRLLRKDC